LGRYIDFNILVWLRLNTIFTIYINQVNVKGFMKFPNGIKVKVYGLCKFMNPNKGKCK
jgi:hypothetical protein